MMKKWSIILIVCLTLGMNAQAFSLENNMDKIESKTISEETYIGEKISGNVVEEKEAVKLEDIVVETSVPLNVRKINKKFEYSDNLASIAEAYYMRGIEIDGKTCSLYPEFEQPEVAMDKIKEKCTNAINYLRTQDNLPELTGKTAEQWHGWSSYYTDEENELNETIHLEMLLLDEFLNLYENTHLNDEICDTVKKSGCNLKDSRLLAAADIVSELQYTMPYNTGCNEALNDVTEKMLNDVEKKYNVSQIEVQKMYDAGEREIADRLENKSINAEAVKEMAYSGNSKFNVAKGVAYAEKYATNPNKNYRNWIKDKVDCTNFVSQIKTAGGVKHYYAYITVKYEQQLVKSKSWYYSSKNNYGGIWPTADKFAKFFGVKSTTSDFYTFSSRVKKGSFIAYDKENDGKWNHMAFVTNKSSTVKKTGNVKYYDFKIAQHSSEYNAWVSARKEGWKTLKKKYPKTKFAIIN